jgi:TPR repeat protein
MEKIMQSLEIDQAIWAAIEASESPYDFLDFIRHGLNHPTEHEEAFRRALKYWDNKKAIRLADKAVEKLLDMADKGNESAVFHLGRWYRLGYFVEKNSEIGLDWYRKGAEHGCTRCMVNLGRYKADTDTGEAAKIYQGAVDAGDLSAHTFWAQIDPDRTSYHLEAGARSSDGLSLFTWGLHLLKMAESDEGKAAAFSVIEDAANRNESAASLFLGVQYRSGKNVRKDAGVSMRWLKKSASLGNPTACAMLGNKLLPSKKTEQKAMMYLRHAAMLDEAYGQFMLGMHLFWSGKKLSDQTKGLNWLRQAATNGYRPAIIELVQALTTGRKTRSNTEEAIDWLHKGVAHGIADCQVHLGCLYMIGRDIEVNKTKAHNLYHLASLQGNDDGTYFLGLSYLDGDGCPIDHEKAYSNLKEAAENGHPKAQYKLGCLALFGEGDKEDIPAAAKWLKLAAESNLADAQFYLGWMFSNGIGVEENEQRARLWFEKACRQDHPEAMRTLGLMFIEGNGARLDRKEGQRLVAKAAALGDKVANDWMVKNLPAKPQWLKDMGNSHPDSKVAS